MMLGQQSGLAFEDNFCNELVKYWMIDRNQDLDRKEKVDLTIQRPVGSKTLLLGIRVQLTTRSKDSKKLETFLRIQRDKHKGCSVYLEVPSDTDPIAAALAFS